MWLGRSIKLFTRELRHGCITVAVCTVAVCRPVLVDLICERPALDARDVANRREGLGDGQGSVSCTHLRLQ